MHQGGPRSFDGYYFYHASPAATDPLHVLYQEGTITEQNDFLVIAENHHPLLPCCPDPATDGRLLVYSNFRVFWYHGRSWIGIDTMVRRLNDH